MQQGGIFQYLWVFFLLQLRRDEFFSFSCRCWHRAVCHRDARSTGRCRTRACAATGRLRPTPARAVRCSIKPCPTTSCSAPHHLTTARSLLAWSTTRARPTCAVSANTPQSVYLLTISTFCLVATTNIRAFTGFYAIQKHYTLCFSTLLYK